MWAFDIIIFVLVQAAFPLHFETDRTTTAALSKRGPPAVSADEDVTCSVFYGHPDPEDCHEVIEDIEDSARQSGVDLYSKVEFIAVGYESQPSAINSYHTPLYWKSKSGERFSFESRRGSLSLAKYTGNCIAALFVDQRPGHITSDLETWEMVYLNADTVNYVCVDDRGMGGYMSNLGTSRGLNIYLFSPGSPFDLLLDMKLRCPVCNQWSCSASNSNSQECSNNPNVTEKSASSPDPQVPSTLPHQVSDFHTTAQRYCNIPCSSHADCDCGAGYRCMQDSFWTSQLKKATMACIFRAISLRSKGKREDDLLSEDAYAMQPM